MYVRVYDSVCVDYMCVCARQMCTFGQVCINDLNSVFLLGCVCKCVCLFVCIHLNIDMCENKKSEIKIYLRKLTTDFDAIRAIHKR